MIDKKLDQLIDDICETYLKCMEDREHDRPNYRYSKEEHDQFKSALHRHIKTHYEYKGEGNE